MKFSSNAITSDFDVVSLYSYISLIDPNKISIEKLFKLDQTLMFEKKNIIIKLLDIATSLCVCRLILYYITIRAVI